MEETYKGGLPKAKNYADDRIPRLDEIQKILTYPDWRMRAIVCTMASSGYYHFKYILVCSGFVSRFRLVRKDHLIFAVAISMLVISSPSISNHGYFETTKVVYGQPDSDQINSNTANSVNLQDIPLEKVHVGDIDVA
jgi:hypothetical protein